MLTNFSLVLKKEWIERRRMLIIGVISVFSAYIITGLMLGLLGLRGGYGSFILSYLIAIILCMIFSSFAFSSMKEKSGRISTLTLPASPGAKYLSRLLVTGPCLLLVIIAGFYLGESVRILMAKIQHGYWGSYSSIAHSASVFGGASGVIVILSSYMFYQALFFWGSAMWPRFSFIKTMLVFAIIETVQTIAVIIWLFSKRHELEAMAAQDIHAEVYDINPFGTWSIIINFAIAAALYVWAYYRFRRDNVVYKLF